MCFQKLARIHGFFGIHFLGVFSYELMSNVAYMDYEAERVKNRDFRTQFFFSPEFTKKK